MEKQLTIDIHTHILPEKWPDWRAKFGYGGFARIEPSIPGEARIMIDDKFFRTVNEKSWNPELRMLAATEQQVDVQVLSTAPFMFNYEARGDDNMMVSQFLNDHIAGLVKEYPDRFLGLGTVPLQTPKLAIEELERCMGELGLQGIIIGSQINEWSLHSEALLPFWEAAERLNASVLIHPWNIAEQTKLNDYMQAWTIGMPAESARAIGSIISGGILEKFPNLRLAFVHGGGAFPSVVGRMQKALDSRPDLTAVDNSTSIDSYCGKFWVDSLVHDKDYLNFLVQKIGPNRVMMGSDFPYSLSEKEPVNRMKQDIDNLNTQKMLLSGSALEWLNISAERFAYRPKWDTGI